MSDKITPAQKTALLKLQGFKAIRDQYAKEKKMAGSGKRRMKGRGFWDDVYNWFVDAGTTVNDFLKRTKLISNVAGAVLPILAPLGTALLTANPVAAAASVGAAKAAAQGISSLGYGKRKGKGATQDAEAIARAIVGKKLKGGDARLSLVPAPMRLRGNGSMTISNNGSYQKQAYPINSGIMGNMKGRGAGTEYGVVSSAFGTINAQ